MRWLIVAYLGVTGLGCATAHRHRGEAVLPETVVEPTSTANEQQLTASLEAAAQAPGQPTPIEPPRVEEYTLQPDDILQITVYEEPDLTTRARVTSSGGIAFPLLGHVGVAGLTVPQVQEKLTQLLAEDYLINPQVQVFIEAYHLRNVFVTGAVNRPGAYPIPIEKPTTLMEAIAMAGGFSNVAAPNNTRIVRLEEGQQRTLNVRADDIVRKGDKTQDVPVRPNDIIFVPESFF